MTTHFLSNVLFGISGITYYTAFRTQCQLSSIENVNVTSVDDLPNKFKNTPAYLILSGLVSVEKPAKESIKDAAIIEEKYEKICQPYPSRDFEFRSRNDGRWSLVDKHNSAKTVKCFVDPIVGQPLFKELLTEKEEIVQKKNNYFSCFFPHYYWLSVPL